MSTPLNDPPLHWAPKIQPGRIQRLYEQDARGIVDDDLLNDVGWALLERCRSIVLVSSSMIACPRCDTEFRFHAADAQTVVACPTGCGWGISGAAYHRSWRHRDLIGTNTPAFVAFIERFPRAATPREQLIAIDRLLHAFHQMLRLPGPHRSAAANLIEGNHDQVLAFLDRLSYGEHTTPELREAFAAWQPTARAVAAQRNRKR